MRHLRTRHLIACTTALTLSLLGDQAAAQNQGFALDRFDPSEAGSDWFSAESLDFRGDVRPTFGLVPEWAYKPLVIYDADGNEQSAIVEHQVFVHLNASLVLIDRLRVGVSFPMALATIGDGGTVDGVSYQASEGVAAGDLRVGVDARIVGQYGDPAVLAAGVQVHAPTGSQDSFAGDGKARIAGRLMLAGDIGLFTYAVRAGVNGRFQDENFAGAPFGTELAYGAAAGVRLVDGALVLGPELSGSSVLADDGGGFSTSTGTPIELLLGGHYALDNGLRFGLGAGPGLTDGLGSPTVRVLGAIEWSMPYEEEVEPPPPPPPADRDNDGIIDQNDACPDVAGIESDDPKKNGCPPPPADADGDGIVDADDACPNVAGVASDDPAKHGCPPDSDGDGIVDADDACVDEPGPRSDDPKKNGCPLPQDSDGDGILDPVDACPQVKGEANTDPKKNGCPKAQIIGKVIKIMERVEFDTGRATIRPESDPVLTAVLDIMKGHPEITLVNVEGHTDNAGPKALNLNLSKARAAAVVTWLTAKGIDKKRLASAGFGDTRPIGTNDTVEGRQANRRVEFHIADSKTEAAP